MISPAHKNKSVAVIILGIIVIAGIVMFNNLIIRDLGKKKQEPPAASQDEAVETTSVVSQQMQGDGRTREFPAGIQQQVPPQTAQGPEREKDRDVVYEAPLKDVFLVQ